MLCQGLLDSTTIGQPVSFFVSYYFVCSLTYGHYCARLRDYYCWHLLLSKLVEEDVRRSRLIQYRLKTRKSLDWHLDIPFRQDQQDRKARSHQLGQQLSSLQLSLLRAKQVAQRLQYCTTPVLSWAAVLYRQRASV